MSQSQITAFFPIYNPADPVERAKIDYSHAKDKLNVAIAREIAKEKAQLKRMTTLANYERTRSKRCLDLADDDDDSDVVIDVPYVRAEIDTTTS
jgi:hypothetical protein